VGGSAIGIHADGATEILRLIFILM